MASLLVDVKDSAKDDAKVGGTTYAENDANALLEALLSRNCRNVETILLQHPELVNFDFQDRGIDYGSPLMTICPGSMNNRAVEKAGMKFNNNNNNNNNIYFLYSAAN